MGALLYLTRTKRERWLMHRSMWVGLVVVAGCGGSNAVEPSATSMVPASAVEASHLAPSQLSASTVARPEIPPPCDPRLLSWVAEPGTDASTAAVLTVTNGSEEQCEVDVSGSVGFDPVMEPNVWLDPAASALLVVGATEFACDAATEVGSIELHVNGTSRRIDLPVPACLPSLVAFYPA